MPLLGQASGGWTESSSALRILHVGIRNTVPVLTDDSFTQTNPSVVTAAGTVSAQVDQTKLGVLSGSVAFTRPDAGSAFVGGAGSATVLTTNLRGAPAAGMNFHPVGCFINSANGNPFENTPGTASGKGPYVSSMGTYGNGLFETNLLNDVGAFLQGGTLTYATGVRLMASANGFIMPMDHIIAGAAASLDIATVSAEAWVKNGWATFAGSTVMGIVLMPPDAVQNEVIYDQRI